jgi:uncharacterized RDD family membrane protein YckC
METGNPYAAPQAGDVYGATASAQPLATAGARFLARFLDGLIEGAPYLIGLVLFGVMSSEQSPALVPLLLGILGSVIIWVYQTVLLVKTGQTLGKKWSGVKVVRLDGSVASLGNQFLRGLVFGLLGIISIVFIFRADRRCLHDMAGETKVIAV